MVYLSMVSYLVRLVVHMKLLFSTMNMLQVFHLVIIHIGSELFDTIERDSELIFQFLKYEWFIIILLNSYWSTGSKFGDHLCRLSIQTNKASYGPWAAHHGQCGSVSAVKISSTFQDYLRKNSSLSSKNMMLLKKGNFVYQWFMNTLWQGLSLVNFSAVNPFHQTESIVARYSLFSI